MNEGAPVVGQDLVRPYLLLATSYGGTMATTAKFTAIRVVYNHTLTMDAGGSMKEASSQSEHDNTEGPVVQCVRVPHMRKFDAGAVLQQLGIVLTAWARWLVDAKLLAQVDVTEAQADKLVAELLVSVQRAPKGQPQPNVRASRGYKRLMSLFQGEQIGADLSGTSSARALLNDVTDFVDHE